MRLEGPHEVTGVLLGLAQELGNLVHRRGTLELVFEHAHGTGHEVCGGLGWCGRQRKPPRTSVQAAARGPPREPVRF